ncbi:membrane protein [Clostridium acetobutylicum]|uniref:tRNA-processing ribonuclease BN n=1 Tax=Clostridium acetobutylicum (strain ATCC 824 / DSM 792 / JCM 1419 / IAM 19013 / LMG 5710 / NBRC 13948 / NRRL B-527 / VKM B-1787 / 2291 / W) TaxID=272562 RepID=Q97LR9_CLOAB|nr:MULTISPECIES: YhjD/YihY/BrkB family envelope integrity protein [Clostridium]AAK78465.1 TRNA-processing ribonuclease BN [Clostridium acetobutylicum ATCC 824]ADZ19535.1 TRNA-processing ribonuclease BN [Clostridium acetobutylicum EA 2018]AEI33772.1 tRNA-processing ribonuclease BN [Clostridium acetobutylicum DSM 1731]AWV80187.1 YihY/virulence factor BrkB family protein [Clostridium acetobutylicum]KHD37741.1 ribonuclease BN [Clostridium acetobutylicum]
MSAKLLRIKNYVSVFIKRLIDDGIIALSSQLAYSLIFAFFPFLIFLMTLVGFSSIKSSDVLEAMRKVVPYQVYGLVKNIVKEVVDTKNGKLLSVSLITSIWSCVSGFNAVIRGLNNSYKDNERRSFLKVQLISIIFTFGLIITIFFAMLLIVFGDINEELIIKKFGINEFFGYGVWDLIKYGILTIGMIFSFAALYRYTPANKHKWKMVFPGAVISALGWVISSICFTYYVNNFGNYSKVYGSIGAVIVLMTWLFIISFIIICGGEINAVYFEIKNPNKLTKS